MVGASNLPQGWRRQDEGRRGRQEMRPSPLSPGLVQQAPELPQMLDAPMPREVPYPYVASAYQAESPPGYHVVGPLPGCPQHEGGFEVAYGARAADVQCEHGMGAGQFPHAPFGYLAQIAEAPSRILSTSPTSSPQHCRGQPASGSGPEGRHQASGGPQAGAQPQPGQQQQQQQRFPGPPLATQAYAPGELPVEGQRYGKQRGGQGRWGSQKQVQESHINQMKNNEITRKEPPWTDVTTVMMRNLPNKYTQQMLLEELHFNGFRLQYDFDFFYLPMDHSNAVNLGYCFINFVETRIANAFACTFSGKRMRRFNSSKTVIVMPASIQGFERNYAYYASTRVAQAEDPQYRPIFMRAPPPPEAPQFQPTPMQMWEHPHQELPYMDSPQPWAFVELTADCSRDEQPQLQMPHIEHHVCALAGSSAHPEALGERMHQAAFPESLLVARSHRLIIRNTFLDAGPERSPSVERFMEERQVKSCPVSLPQSEAGSAKIEFGVNGGAFRSAISGSNLINYAVVAAAGGLAQNLGCVATRGRSYPAPEESSVDESSGEGRLHSSRGSTRDSAQSSPPLVRQQPSSSCGSADLQTNTTPSDLDGPALGSPELPCKGSSLHRWGACKPCAFHYQGETPGCKNGIECPFCHLCEPGEKKRRKKERQAIKREHREHGVRKVDSAAAPWKSTPEGSEG